MKATTMRASAWILRLMLAALVALTLGGVAVAPAAAAEATGSGTLTAKGVGTARIEGSGSVVIAGGAGTVWVNGADTITTEGKGRRTTLADGTVRLTGYSGRITIAGEELVVRVAGGAIELTATGTGSVVLAGKGTYSAGGKSGAWAKNGVTVTF